MKISPSNQAARPAVGKKLLPWQQPTSESPDFLTKTREFLMPWTKTQAERPLTPTGTRRVYAGNSPPDGQPQKQKGIFSSWFPATDLAPERPKSATDFLSQPRVGFNEE